MSADPLTLGVQCAPVLRDIRVVFVNVGVCIEGVEASGGKVPNCSIDAVPECLGAKVGLHEVKLMLHLPADMIQAGARSLPRGPNLVPIFAEKSIRSGADHTNVVIGVAV